MPHTLSAIIAKKFSECRYKSFTGFNSEGKWEDSRSFQKIKVRPERA